MRILYIGGYACVYCRDMNILCGDCDYITNDKLYGFNLYIRIKARPGITVI